MATTTGGYNHNGRQGKWTLGEDGRLFDADGHYVADVWHRNSGIWFATLWTGEVVTDRSRYHACVSAAYYSAKPTRDERDAHWLDPATWRL